MFRIIVKFFLSVIIFFLTFTVSSQSSNKLWTEISVYEKPTLSKTGNILNPTKFNVLRLNIENLRNKLSNSFSEDKNSGKYSIIVSFPNENGLVENYEVFEASVMEEGLQNKFPNIKSYIGRGIDRPGSIVRFSITSLGLNAIILQNTGGTIVIDPYGSNSELYKVYSVESLPSPTPFECKTESLIQNINTKTSDLAKGTIINNDGLLRKFRLAVAVTGEYSQYHLSRLGIDPLTSDEEKIEIVMSTLVSTITNSVSLFERDLTITMTLVENNDKLIFLDPGSDNLSNNAFNIFNETQVIIDDIIGSENYDLGHVLATGIEGGVAAFGYLCESSVKATAVSGSSLPLGFDFEKLINHEMAHQLGANHTFNGVTLLGTINPVDTRVEPGSGSTIMAYPGTCLDNIQLVRDNYFHFVTIKEIWNQINSDNSNCFTIEDKFNSLPVINNIPNYFVPVSTPFVLEVNASDEDTDYDQLTYTWEQLDNELAIAPPISTATEGPAFRSLPPSYSSKRYFPNRKTIIDGKLENKWEVLPSVARTMKFGILVRDNTINGGQIASEEVTLTFEENSGPFEVYSQNESILWFTNDSKTIKWNVANTNLPPVNCSNVNILLSTDGGYTYPIVLAENILNDGSQEIEVPNVETNIARVKVESVGNIFYAINSKNIAIQKIEDTDYDDDGVINENDICPLTPIGEEVDSNGCSESQLDNDDDGVFNSLDNCIDSVNTNQSDIDGDGIGDFCDEDIDGDGIMNLNDNCPEVANEDQLDTDGDGVGDVCDQDLDGDGVNNEMDQCLYTPLGEIVGLYGCTESDWKISNELWGMTNYGGQGFGAVFTFDITTGTENNIHNFDKLEGGRLPIGSLMQASNGSLYGMTKSGGTRHLGVLFEYNVTRKEITKKVDFTGKENGQWPQGDLIQANNGKLYGMTREGGEYGKGVLFEYDILSETYTKKVDFDGVYSGANPYGSLVQASDGKLYGTTVDEGENNMGVLFEYDIITNTLTKILDFEGATTGRHCFGTLVEGRNGMIYGMTRYGGVNDRGVIFEYDIQIKTLVIKAHFDDVLTGGGPISKLTEYNEGVFYGVTEEGGIFGLGTLFEFNLNEETITKKVDFDGDYKGSYPRGSLLMASNDLLYGMTQHGGINSFGVLFEYNVETENFQKKLDFGNSNIGYSPSNTTLIELNMDLDNDGVINIYDQCPNTPIGETVNSDGCSESQFDDDNDGVPNSIDQCPDTTAMSTVDAYGCFTLPFDNFKIEVVGESCIDKDNGQINITANASYNYITTIKGVNYDFTNSLIVNNLEAGEYSVCISVIEEPLYEQCYNLVVEEASEITGKSSSTKVGNKTTEIIEITTGTAPYILSVNGIEVQKTNSNILSSEVSHGDLLSVTSKFACEGKFEKNIDLSNEFIVYPNPTSGLAEIDMLNVDEKEVVISIFNLQQQLISRKTYQIEYGKVGISLKDMSSGIYFVKIELDTVVHLKVIKK